MDIKDFVDVTHDTWRVYLRRVQSIAEQGLLHFSSTGSQEALVDRIILYPNILVFTETKHHFMAELIGAQSKFDRLEIKRHHEKSTERYLSQFTDEPGDGCFHLNDSENGISNLCLSQQDVDFEAVENRFPVVKLFQSRLVRTGGHGTLFSFGENFESAYIENCILVNRLLTAYRVKHILHMIIVNKKILPSKYKALLTQILSQEIIKGVHICNPNQERDYVLAGQFQSCYLFPNLHETTIGEFLHTHPEIIERALSARSLIYEPYLRWVKKPAGLEDEAINPDLLLQRQDGYYDVYDLKTAALGKNHLTKGSRRRRRFIDYVEEGIAQLANYREYFSYAENANYAKEKYGIELKKPDFVLIVGNYQNSEPTKIAEACRRFNDFTIIDYDTLIHLFLCASI